MCPIPLYANVWARARLAAVSIYSAHMGTLPAALTDLTSVVTNTQGQAGGPFASGTFTISNSGDSTSVSVP